VTRVLTANVLKLFKVLITDRVTPDSVGATSPVGT
jgi:hypothetical protein